MRKASATEFAACLQEVLHEGAASRGDYIRPKSLIAHWPYFVYHNLPTRTAHFRSNEALFRRAVQDVRRQRRSMETTQQGSLLPGKPNKQHLLPKKTCSGSTRTHCRASGSLPAESSTACVLCRSSYRRSECSREPARAGLVTTLRLIRSSVTVHKVHDGVSQ